MPVQILTCTYYQGRPLRSTCVHVPAGLLSCLAHESQTTATSKSSEHCTCTAVISQEQSTRARQIQCAPLAWLWLTVTAAVSPLNLLSHQDKHGIERQRQQMSPTPSKKAFASLTIDLKIVLINSCWGSLLIQLIHYCSLSFSAPVHFVHFMSIFYDVSKYHNETLLMYFYHVGNKTIYCRKLSTSLNF